MRILREATFIICVWTYKKSGIYITPNGFFITVIKYNNPIFFFFFHLSDHALVGHVVHTTVAMDEFECQLKCMGTNRCKSAINVLPGDCIGQRNSELKNKTR